MPIELRNDINPALTGALQYLLSQQQQRNQQAAQNQESNKQFLDAINAAAQQAMGPQQAYGAVSPDGMAPGQPQPSGGGGLRPNAAGMRLAEQQNALGAQFAQQASGRMHDLARDQQNFEQQLISNEQQFAHQGQQQQQQLANQEELAAYNTQLELYQKNQQHQIWNDPVSLAEAQKRINAQGEALTAAEREARKTLMEGIAKGDPGAIESGLREGLLYFSPEQQTLIRQYKEQLSAIDQDERLSEADKFKARMMIENKLAAIRPMETPLDKVPPTPMEMFLKNHQTIPGKNGGPDLTYRKIVRNGEEVWELTKESELALQSHLKQQEALFNKEHGIDQKHNPEELQQKLEFDRQKNAMAVHKEAMSAKTALLSQIGDLNVKIITAKANLKAAQATPDAADDSEAQMALSELQVQIQPLQLELQRYDQIMAQAAQVFGSPQQPHNAPPQGMADSLAARSGGISPTTPSPTAAVPPPTPPVAAPPAPQTAPPAAPPPQPAMPPGTAPKMNVKEPKELVAPILRGEIGEGDWVMTSKGPKQLTKEAINKIIYGQ